MKTKLYKTPTLIHMPRTGGTFLGSALQHISNFEIGSRHKTAIQYDRDDYFLFGLIRNPFDWYVSRFEYYRNTRPTCVENGASKYNDLGLQNDYFIEKCPTLKHHILHGLAIAKDNRFFFSDMYNYMFCDINQQLLLDCVCKFENMDEEIYNVFKQHKIHISQNISKESHFRNASKRHRYREYYDQELYDIIVEKDRFILDTYNYKF